ncbi:MAG: hypothetical protein JTT11_10740 [Candidatus Brockarchaeota archaeon]|nr:hypothetical protein [Candidatus Brockarchaeota archaeon]
MSEREREVKCWRCGCVFLAQEQPVSGYDSESTQMHYHCPICATKLPYCRGLDPKDVSKLVPGTTILALAALLNWPAIFFQALAIAFLYGSAALLARQ